MYIQHLIGIIISTWLKSPTLFNNVCATLFGYSWSPITTPANESDLTYT